MFLPRGFFHLSLLRRELQQWHAPIACRRQEKKPPSPGHPSAWSITRTTGASPASSSLTGKLWPSPHLPSRRTGKRPCSSGFTPLLSVSGFPALLCLSGSTPLHFARPVCVAAGLPRCSVSPGLSRCSVSPGLPRCSVSPGLPRCSVFPGSSRCSPLAPYV